MSNIKEAVRQRTAFATSNQPKDSQREASSPGITRRGLLKSALGLGGAVLLEKVVRPTSVKAAETTGKNTPSQSDNSRFQSPAQVIFERQDLAEQIIPTEIEGMPPLISNATFFADQAVGQVTVRPYLDSLPPESVLVSPDLPEAYIAPATPEYNNAFISLTQEYFNEDGLVSQASEGLAKTLGKDPRAGMLILIPNNPGNDGKPVPYMLADKHPAGPGDDDLLQEIRSKAVLAQGKIPLDVKGTQFYILNEKQKAWLQNIPVAGEKNSIKISPSLPELYANNIIVEVSQNPDLTAQTTSLPVLDNQGKPITGAVSALSNQLITGYDTITKHNVPEVFMKEFRDEYKGAALRLMGRPISEAVVMKVWVTNDNKVQEQREVLYQAFERGSLTYDPKVNDPMWTTQASLDGNIFLEAITGNKDFPSRESGLPSDERLSYNLPDLSVSSIGPIRIQIPNPEQLNDFISKNLGKRVSLHLASDITDGKAIVRQEVPNVSEDQLIFLRDGFPKINGAVVEFGVDCKQVKGTYVSVPPQDRSVLENNGLVTPQDFTDLKTFLVINALGQATATKEELQRIAPIVGQAMIDGITVGWK